MFLDSKYKTEMWLSRFPLDNRYQIMDDLTVNVDGNVRLSGYNLSEIPVQFGVVTGYFDCSSNKLTSLKGTPRECQEFDCSKNQLTTLEHGPRIVHKFYNCSKNNLTTLKGAPEKVYLTFSCQENQLTSLEYLSEGMQNILCADNQISDMKACPSLSGNLDMRFNPLPSLKDLPDTIGGSLMIRQTPEKAWNLKELNTQIGHELYIDYSNIYKALVSGEITQWSFSCQTLSVDSPGRQIPELKEYYNNDGNLDIEFSKLITLAMNYQLQKELPVKEGIKRKAKI